MKNKKDYWDAVDGSWRELCVLMVMFLDYGKDEMLAVEKMRKARDVALLDVFHETWWKAPDARGLHGLAGWDVLCDLCSEKELATDGGE